MKNKEQARFTLLLAGVFFILVFVISFSLIKTTSREMIKEKQSIQPTRMVPTPIKIGSFTLVPPQNKSIFGPDKEVKIVAYGDSKNIPIAGYDLVLGYNPKQLKFLAAKNIVEGFQAFVSQKGNEIYLTSVKEKEATASVAFKNIPVAEFTFESIASGAAAVELRFANGLTTDSNLLSEDAKDILTDVSNTSIYLGNSLTLQKNKEVTLPDKKTSLTLLEVLPLRAGCADCFETATVKIKNGEREKIIEFKAGGIAGIVELDKEEFGWKLEAETFRTNQLTLNVVQE